MELRALIYYKASMGYETREHFEQAGAESRLRVGIAQLIRCTDEKLHWTLGKSWWIEEFTPSKSNEHLPKINLEDEWVHWDMNFLYTFKPEHLEQWISSSDSATPPIS